MSDVNNGFESVSQQNAMWDPRTIKDSNDIKVTQAVTDKSYMVGYYLESREVDIKGKKATIHTIQLDTVGDSAHLSQSTDKGGKVDFWGTAVLNDMIANNVSYGQFIKIQWEGMKVSGKKEIPMITSVEEINKIKASSATAYHVWDLAKNSSVEPLGGASIPTTPEATTAEPVAADDDLPF
jgi:hypothetical protein